MSVIEDATKVRYLYKVTEFSILYEKGTESLSPERIISLKIVNDYMNNIFPIFSIQLALETQLYYKILKNKDSVKFHIRLQKYYKGLTGGETSSLYRDCINDTFQLILDDNDSDLEESLRKIQNNTDYINIEKKTTNDLNEITNICEFYLYKSSIIKSCSKTVNTVLQDAFVVDAITYILSQGEIKNTIISPVENMKKYNTILIPPLKINKALSFIDSYYGLYNNGSVIFFGLDRNYIIAYNGKCTAYQSNEIRNTSIIIPKKTDTSSQELCVLLPKEKKDINYIIASSMNISTRDDSVSGDILQGNNITIVNSDEGSIRSYKNTSDYQHNTKIIVNKTENEFVGNIYKAQTESNTGVIQLSLGSYDIDMLSPNKKITVLFEDSSLSSKYKGNYMIGSITHNLSKDGSEMVATADITLRKIK